jgi:hypothetical protein
MTKSATVTSGPGVWLGKQGAVLYMDLEWVVVELISKDDCGLGVFNVRFPISCVKVVQELAVA